MISYTCTFKTTESIKKFLIGKKAFKYWSLLARVSKFSCEFHCRKLESPLLLCLVLSQLSLDFTAICQLLQKQSDLSTLMCYSSLRSGIFRGEKRTILSILQIFYRSWWPRFKHRNGKNYTNQLQNLTGNTMFIIMHVKREFRLHKTSQWHSFKLLKGQFIWNFDIPKVVSSAIYDCR